VDITKKSQKKPEAEKVGPLMTITIGINNIGKGGEIGDNGLCVANVENYGGRNLLSLLVNGKGSYMMPFPEAGADAIERVIFPKTKLIVDPALDFSKSNVVGGVKKKALASAGTEENVAVETDL